MKTDQLYFDDPLCLEFTAEIIEVNPSRDGKFEVVLPATYFYPTGGGQDHDTGKIGGASVLDVNKTEDGRIIHLLDQEIIPGAYPARIDKMRRWQNLQAHTAQHILSRAFEIESNLETISANINSDRPSTIDLDCNDPLKIDFSREEGKANSIVFEDRIVRSYNISDDDIPRIPFRKPPKVSGNIRVVEVDGFDYSACGGTHCLRTGMVGLIKILRIEIQNRKTRLHFVSGYQALQVFQDTHSILTRITGVMDTGKDELVSTIIKQTENNKKMRAELETLRSMSLADEAVQLRDSSFSLGEADLVTRLFPDRAVEDLRKLVGMIRSEKKIVILLGTLEGRKLSLVAGCSDDVHLDARKLLNFHLERFNGHGGGDQFLAQGGCILPTGNLDNLFNETGNYVLSEMDH
jgi:alanyl-tRNA synthetase